MGMKTSDDEVLAQLKRFVDCASDQLQWGNLTVPEAIALIRKTQSEAERLIPVQMELYHLIYTSRFRRLLEQFVIPKQLNQPINRHKPYDTIGILV